MSRCVSQIYYEQQIERGVQRTLSGCRCNERQNENLCMKRLERVQASTYGSVRLGVSHTLTDLCAYAGNTLKRIGNEGFIEGDAGLLLHERTP